MVSKISKEDVVKRMAHLLNVIGKDGHKPFKLSDNDYKDVTKALDVFEANIIYEHYIFNKRTQEVGEC